MYLAFEFLMPGFMANAPAARNDHTACSGCSLCLLVCPVWRRTCDLRMTPHGRAKALQHGASVLAIATSIESCTLCGACEPVCPQEIDLVGMIVDLRRQLSRSAPLADLRAGMTGHERHPVPMQSASRNIFLPGQALRRHPETLARVQALLEIDVCEDDGADIAQALETGGFIPAQRRKQILASLRRLNRIIVADGLLLRHLREWMPGSKITSLGAALSGLAIVRHGLRATDLYVIEPRAYHADYRRLVKYYDRLRADTGCAMNLDLQRIAIPATAHGLPQRLGLAAPDDGAQARWILHGRSIARIVVENPEDASVFAQVCDCPVVHLADLADDGKMVKGIQS